MPKVEVELSVEQLAAILASLSPGDQETLALLLDPALTKEILARRQDSTRLTWEEVLAD
ncbi:MAG: hypothetical protein HY347_04785 [candidate division NC10 bacterium]|nr:hypothetical protein [candidate division NC10 bacterium]